MNLGHNQWFHPPNRLIFTYGTPRLPPSGSTAGAAFAPLRLDGTRRLPPSGSTGRGGCPPPAPRDAAFAPLRLDYGLRPLADSPSRGE